MIAPEAARDYWRAPRQDAADLRARAPRVVVRGGEDLRYHIVSVWGREHYLPPSYHTADKRVLDHRAELVRYARECALNNPLYQRLVALLADYVLGADGAELLLDAPGLSDEDKKNLQAAWAEWCERCDAREEAPFTSLEREIIREVISVGEVLVVINADRTLSIIPTEQILEPERNRAGVVRFYRYKYRGEDGATYQRRVPAEDGIFLYRKTEPSATRGVGLLWSSFVYLFYMDNFLRCTSKAATEAAKWAIVLNDPNADNRGRYVAAPPEGPQAGDALPTPDGGAAYAVGDAGDDAQPVTIENGDAGMVVYGVPGTETKILNNPKPEASLEAGLRPFLKLICASAGVPVDLALADYSQQSYSSSKSLSLHLQATLAVLGNELVHKFYKKIFRRCVSDQPVSFVLPRLQVVDEYKEAQADGLRLSSSLATATQILKEKNKDLGDFLRTREDELKQMWRTAERAAAATGGAVPPAAIFAAISGIKEQ